MRERDKKGETKESREEEKERETRGNIEKRKQKSKQVISNTK